MKKIAFLILVPLNCDPVHFGKLLKILDNQSDIYVQVDLKSDISLYKSVTDTKNVTFLHNRVAITSWTGITVIDAKMELIKAAMIKKDQYTHLVLISGSCYPIKPIEEIHRLFAENPSHEFIKLADMRQDSVKWIHKKYFPTPFFNTNSNLLLFVDKAIRKVIRTMHLKNSWNGNIIPYFGSEWFALTTNCCQYILDYQVENPWYRKMNKHAFCPHEHYFHTLVGNSHFLPHTDGVKSFQGRDVTKYANLHLLDKSYTKYFTQDDWEEISGSEKQFVRKVRSSDGRDLVERINLEILNIS